MERNRSSLRTGAALVILNHFGYPLDDWLLDRSEQGHSIYAIAEELADLSDGVIAPTPQTISNWRKEAGWEAQGKETA